MPRFILNQQTGEYDIKYDAIEGRKMTEIKPIIPSEDQMFIRKLYGGLPIYDTSTGINPKVGQIFLVSCGSSTRFCARFLTITNSTSLT